MGRAEFMRPPGHLAMSYRSDASAFKTAEVPEHVRAPLRALPPRARGRSIRGDSLGGPRRQRRAPFFRLSSIITSRRPFVAERRPADVRPPVRSLTSLLPAPPLPSRQSLAAKREIETRYRGADPLGTRGPSWNQSNYVEQNYHFRDKSVPALLSTAAAPMGPSADAHAATARVIRKGDLARGSRSIAFSKNGAMEGGGWRSTTLTTPEELRDRLETTRRETEAHCAEATSRILTRTGYRPPWKLEEERMATMRALKAKGHWPAPPPPVEVIECTKRSKATRADIRAVMELDDFVAPADAENDRARARREAGRGGRRG